MQSIIKYSLITFFLLFASMEIHATHNRAGEITYVQIDDLTIRATITTYTKASSVDADRDSLEILWGDGTSSTLVRINGSGDILDNNIKRNYYSGVHTYPGQGTYTMSMLDPNRVASVLNINWPNSVNVPFYIETTFTFLNPQFQGFNNSVILLQDPIDLACVGQRFIHNPNAYDSDGDSLAFEFFVPYQGINDPVPNYKLPDQIAPNENNNITIDPITGTVIWDAPQLQGEYNLAIKINEYRGGLLINSITRDMQIVVQACDNRPPVIQVQDEICVIAGEHIQLDILVDDVDEGQKVQLTATGGPFELGATLKVKANYQDAPLSAVFDWQTSCNDVSDNAYQIVLRAVDNFYGNSGLADLKTVRIKIVAPPPLDIQGKSEGNQIQISWESPYNCENTENEYFRGFSVWRKINSDNTIIDSCSNGLANSSYKKIVFLTNEKKDDRYFAIDKDVDFNTIYCYRVIAEFAKLTSNGNPFNKTTSLPSDEVCLLLKRDLPFITHVDVLTTNSNDGRIGIKWIKPLAEDLDTITHPGPYTYKLLRGIGENATNFNPVNGVQVTSTFFNQSISLEFIDIGLNTINNQYSYKIELYTSHSSSAYGESKPASSIFSDAKEQDKSIVLNWEVDVPWSNYGYVVFRQNSITNTFDSIAMTSTPMFTDLDLENDTEYCYKIQSIGTYGLSNVLTPLLNYSQEICATPFDNQAPCTPMLSVTTVCDDEDLMVEGMTFENYINWTMPDLSCPGTSDLSGYKIFYSPFRDESLELIAQFDDIFTTDYIHEREGSIAGCYAITAIDSMGNESQRSDIICKENCPFYVLPNVFTPNGDNVHEVFRPSTLQFIDKIEMEIYNRWGQKVFVTEDPEVNWDGTNLKGKILPDGAYYYTCRVYIENTKSEFIQNDILTGYVHIVGSNK